MTITLRNHEVEVERNRTKLSKAYDQFKVAKELEGCRPRTLKDHDEHFKYLMNFCNVKNIKITYLDEVTIPLCRSYIDYMKNEKGKWDNHKFIESNQKGLSETTINIRLRSLKTQFNFYVADGYIDKNPWNSIKFLRTDEDKIQSLSEVHIKKLFKVPDKRTFVGFRNYVIMSLLLDTGLRINELLSLKERDIDFQKGIIHIQARIAKSRVGRSVPISENSINLLMRLIKENSILENRGPELFLSVTGNRLSDSDVRRFLREYRKKAKIEDIKVYPHLFRHTFAKHYILSGGDPFTLQGILGHKTMEMVRLYIQMNEDDLKNQHDHYSPLKLVNKGVSNSYSYIRSDEVTA